MLEVAGFNPINHQLPINGHRCVLKALDDRKVGIGEVGVLPHHGDVHFLGERVKVVGHCLPFFQKVGGRTVNAEDFAKALFLKHEGHVVDVGHVVG